MTTPVPALRDDAALVRRAQRGDLDAFEALIRGRLDRLYRTACGILGDPADAEDATQEACIAAWQHLPTLRDAERLDAWLGRVLLNACRMRLRDKRRVREIRLDDDRSKGEVDAIPDPVAMADRAEAVELVGRALDQVSFDDRALLLMHHVHHERVDAIAAALGIPAGTVKWRLSRARTAVQRALGTDR